MLRAFAVCGEWSTTIKGMMMKTFAMFPALAAATIALAGCSSSKPADNAAAENVINESDSLGSGNLDAAASNDLEIPESGNGSNSL